MEQKHYQGLLRKYQKLQAQMDTLMADGTHADAIAAALEDPAIYHEHRPDTEDPEKLLLWELRQLSELLDLVELSQNMSVEDHSVSAWERFKAALRSFLGIEPDPATRSVEELRATLTERIRKADERAAEQQAKEDRPGRRLDYSPIEFTSDPMILSNETLLMENDSVRLRNYLNNNREQLSSSTQAHLEHRIKCCRTVEALEKDPVGRPPNTTYTATRSGAPVTDGLKPEDRIMLNGVHERRSQNTMNGCWSVSLSSQLEYRGVDLTQEEIRAYRPNVNDFDFDKSSVDLTDFSKNRQQPIQTYFGLAARVLPNTAMHHKVWQRLDEREMNEMRTVIRHALTVDNSPLSLCVKGHYRTIVGIEGDRIYFKNPLQIVSSSEKIESMTLSELAHMGKRSVGVEMSWMRDLKPSLGGSVEQDPSFLHIGISYNNGIGYLPTAHDCASISEKLVAVSEQIICQDEITGTCTPIHLNTLLPPRLRFNRLPGGQYNADALQDMMNALTAEPGAAAHDGVIRITECAEALKNGIYADDPTEGMLALAQHYIRTVKDLSAAERRTAPSPELTQLKAMLTAQLGDIRHAIVKIHQAEYNPLLGDPNDSLAYGNVFHRQPTNDAEKKLFDARRTAFDRMNTGMSGMLYLHTAANQIDLLDESWLGALQVSEVKKGAEEIKAAPAFRKMVMDIYDDASKYKYYVMDERAARAAQIKEAKSTLTGAENEALLKEKIRIYQNGGSVSDVDKNAAERAEFLKKVGLDEQYHMKPKAPGSQDDTLESERGNIIKFRSDRIALLNGDASRLYKRFLAQQADLEAKPPQPAPVPTNAPKKTMSEPLNQQIPTQNKL